MEDKHKFSHEEGRFILRAIAEWAVQHDNSELSDPDRPLVDQVLQKMCFHVDWYK